MTLGNMYNIGQGVAKDYKQAYMCIVLRLLMGLV